MIQRFFDYISQQNLKTRLQAVQIKCIRFCLKLGDREGITVKDFEKRNWMPFHERVNQCTFSCIYKFYVKKAPDSMDETFSL